MPVQPTLEEAMRRLRVDDDLLDDVKDAIPQAHAEAVKYLDGKLYPDEEALSAANDPKGIICGTDIIAAQLLLVDALVCNNSDEGADLKRARAFGMLRQHRNMGA
ncbi:MAG: hypothetical protein AB7U71_05910 [Comamonas sp.]